MQVSDRFAIERPRHARLSSKCDSGPLHTCCSVYSVDGHPLPIDELKGIKPVDSIDLSGKRLNIATAIIIGACIKGNEHLRQLKYCATRLNPHA